MGEGTTDVVDDEAHHRFLHVEDGVEAQLVYRRDGERLVLVHTEVPEALSGRGIAGRLVRAAAARAAASGEVVVPRCSYARSWLEDHPDVASTVTIEWGGP